MVVNIIIIIISLLHFNTFSLRLLSRRLNIVGKATRLRSLREPSENIMHSNETIGSGISKYYLEVLSILGKVPHSR